MILMILELICVSISQTVNLRNSDVLRTHSFSGVIFQVSGARMV